MPAEPPADRVPDAPADSAAARRKGDRGVGRATPRQPGVRAAGAIEPERRRPGRPRHETPSEDYLKRRREIVDVAVNVFRQNGYDAGSLDDVAVALGLRKASLYYYVRSKAELLYLVFDRAISNALREMEAIAESVAPADRLPRLLRHQIITVGSEPDLFAVFFDQRPRLNTDYEEAIRTKERRYVQIFVDAADAAGASGTVAVTNPRYVAQLVLGMANWTYKWFDPHHDIDELAEIAVNLIVRPGDSGSRAPGSAATDDQRSSGAQRW